MTQKEYTKTKALTCNNQEIIETEFISALSATTTSNPLTIPTTSTVTTTATNSATASTQPSTPHDKIISDIEMGENNQPVKPPRRKISRSTAGDCNETIELDPIDTSFVSFVV